jgi:hypothetical protein
MKALTLEHARARPRPQTERAQILRACARGQHTAGGECEACRQGRHTAPPIVHEVLRSPGRPLDPSARAFMETRFGHDFRAVRAHSDATAARSAEAIQAQAYTVGDRIAFGPGHDETRGRAGLQLLAHELAHVVQQGPAPPTFPDALGIGDPGDPLESSAERVALDVLGGDPQPLAASQAARGPLVRRQVTLGPGAPQVSDLLDLGPGEDLTEKNPRIAAMATKIQGFLRTNPDGKAGVLAFWTSEAPQGPGAPLFVDIAQKTQEARARASSVVAALVKLGVPAKAISSSTPDLGELGQPRTSDGHVVIDLVRPMPTRLPIITPGPVTPFEGVVLDLGEGADLTGKNPRIGEAAQAMPSVENAAGGRVQILAYLRDESGTQELPGWAKKRETAQGRAFTVRNALIERGVRIPIDPDVRPVAAGDKRIGHVIISFIKGPPKPPESAKLPDIGLEKITKHSLKTRWVEVTVTIPKSLDVKGNFIRGQPGLSVSVKGEITKLSDLISPPPTPTVTATGFTQPLPGTPVKISLTASLNMKTYSLDATASVDVGARNVAGGLSVTFLSDGCQMIVPSSTIKDINDAGKKLQDAVNGYTMSPDTAPVPAATQPIPSAAPTQPPPAPPAAVSRILDVVQAMDTIYQAMDTIEKAKETCKKPKLKVGPQVTVPFGPAREPTSDDPARPTIGLGATYYFD